MKNTINLMILIGAVAVQALVAQQATLHPTTFTAQGVLRDAEGRTLADDDYEMTFQIYGNENGTGTALWSETADVEVTNGVWTYTFGSASGNPLDDLDDDGTNYLKITVGTDVLSPLTLLNLNPYETLNVTSGGNKIPATGNVGIGTTNPSFKLDMRGDDENARLGRAEIGGWPANTGYAYFGNRNLNHATAGNYALLQSTTGTTYLNAANGKNIHFRINNSDKMMLKSNGNFGIGTTSPSKKLDVVGDIKGSAVMATGDVTAGDDFHGKELHLANGGNNIWFNNSDMRIKGDGSTAFYFDSHHSSYVQFILRDKEDLQYGRVYGSGDGSSFGLMDGDANWSYRAVKDNYTEFRIDDEIKMKIDGATGNVGIKETSIGGGDLVIGGFNGSSSHNAGNAAIQFKGVNTSGEISFQDQSGDPDICFGYNGSSYVSYINHDGSYAESSDRRLKENIEPLANVLSKVMQLSPKSYKYKESAVGGNRQTKVGFIAQDVQEHFPSIVDDDKEFLGLSYSKFGVLSIKAVQELKNEKDAEIESLNNQLAALTELVNDLQDQLNASQR